MHIPMTPSPVKSPIIINLFGGPGAGKSTLAANTFYHLKCLGLNCEIVTEYAKDLVWRQADRVLTDELYVFAKQNHRMTMIGDQVDYIVTDSPIILPILYDRERDPIFRNLMLHWFTKYQNVNFLLDRKKKYNPVGRTQTEEEAHDLDRKIQNLLDSERIPYHIIHDPVAGWTDIQRTLGL
jgi:hypothetical protein